VNATGKPQAHPVQKLVAGFRVLSYGEPHDREEELVRLSRSKIKSAVKILTEFHCTEDPHAA